MSDTAKPPKIYIPPEQQAGGLISIRTRQGEAINKFISTGQREFTRGTKKELSSDPFNKRTAVQTSFLTLLFSKEVLSDFICGVSTSEAMVLDLFLSDAVEKREHDGSLAVGFSLQTYMNYFGLKDKKEARKQLKCDIERLYNRSVLIPHVIYDKKNNKQKDAGEIETRIISAKAIYQNFYGVVLNPPYWEAVKGYRMDNIDTRVFQINRKLHPYCYRLYRKLWEQASMNYGQPHSDRISITALLRSADFPLEDEVKDRKYKEKIRTPFERDMNKLAELGVLKWAYISEVPKNHKAFMKASIHFSLTEPLRKHATCKIENSLKEEQ